MSSATGNYEQIKAQTTPMAAPMAAPVCSSSPILFQELDTYDDYSASPDDIDEQLRRLDGDLKNYADDIDSDPDGAGGEATGEEGVDDDGDVSTIHQLMRAVPRSRSNTATTLPVLASTPRGIKTGPNRPLGSSRNGSTSSDLDEHPEYLKLNLSIDEDDSYYDVDSLVRMTEPVQADKYRVHSNKTQRRPDHNRALSSRINGIYEHKQQWRKLFARLNFRSDSWKDDPRFIQMLWAGVPSDIRPVLWSHLIGAGSSAHGSPLASSLSSSALCLSPVISPPLSPCTVAAKDQNNSKNTSDDGDNKNKNKNKTNNNIIHDKDDEHEKKAAAHYLGMHQGEKIHFYRTLLSDIEEEDKKHQQGPHSGSKRSPYQKSSSRTLLSTRAKHNTYSAQNNNTAYHQADVDIDKDLCRTLPSQPFFKTEAGRQSLKRTLRAYARYNPIIGYCQGMNFVAGALLLVFQDYDRQYVDPPDHSHDTRHPSAAAAREREEEKKKKRKGGDEDKNTDTDEDKRTEAEALAFWALVHLIDRSGRVHYYTTQMPGCLIDARVLADLVSYQLPEVSAHLNLYGINIKHFCASWILCLFLKTPLPHEYALRLWDVYLVYGDISLFYMTLALLDLNREAILQIDSTELMVDLFLRRLAVLKPIDEMMDYIHDRITASTPTPALASASAASASSSSSSRSRSSPPSATAPAVVSPASTLLHPHALTSTIARLRCTHRYDVVAEGKQLPRGYRRRLLKKFPGFEAKELQDIWSVYVEPDPWYIIGQSGCIQAERLDLFHRAFTACMFGSAEINTWKGRGLINEVMLRLFHLFDAQGKGWVNFEDFLMGCARFCKSNRNERLQLVFDFCTLDLPTALQTNAPGGNNVSVGDGGADGGDADAAGKRTLTKKRIQKNQLYRSIVLLDQVYNGNRPHSQEAALFCQIAYERTRMLSNAMVHNPDDIDSDLDISEIVDDEMDERDGSCVQAVGQGRDLGGRGREWSMSLKQFRSIAILQPLFINFFKLDDLLIGDGE